MLGLFLDHLFYTPAEARREKALQANGFDIPASGIAVGEGAF